MILTAFRRLLYAASLALGASALLFGILDSGLLGDPAIREAGKHATAESLNSARFRLGQLEIVEYAEVPGGTDTQHDRLDYGSLIQIYDANGLTRAWAQPASPLLRFARQTGALFSFRFGDNRFGRPILDTLSRRGLVSAQLALPAFALSTLIALGLAIWAVARGPIAERRMIGLAALVMSISGVVWILLLRYIFATQLQWFPLRGLSPLPVFIWVSLAIWPDWLLYRAIVATEAQRPHLQAARARGIPARTIWLKHLLPNILPPILTQVALALPLLFLGSLLLERAFDIPGLGSFIVQAIGDHDHASLRAVTFIAALAYLAASWLADIAAAFADPRSRKEAS